MPLIALTLVLVFHGTFSGGAAPSKAKGARTSTRAGWPAGSGMAAAGTPATRSLKGAASLGAMSTTMGSTFRPSTTQRPPLLANATDASSHTHAAILIGRHYI